MGRLAGFNYTEVTANCACLVFSSLAKRVVATKFGVIPTDVGPRCRFTAKTLRREP